MKILILSIYSLVLSLAVLALLYLANPLVIEYPKASLAVLICLMFTSFGVGIRSKIEMAILYPMIKIANGKNKLFVCSPILFAIGLLIALVIPWLNGFAAFSVWNWFASIGFTLFVFETFYSFIGASWRVYNTYNEI